MKKLKGIIFDFDGTLADTLPLCILSFQQAFEKITGKQLREEDITRHFGKSEEGIVEELAPDCYEQALKEYVETYEKNHYLCPNVFEGVRELLDGLKERKINTALITGKGKQTIDIALDYMELREYFEYIEHGDPHRPVKAEAIRKIAGLWNMHPSEIAYIGDQPSDITESREAGALAVAVSWAKTSNYELLASYNPDMLFSSIAEFNDWLNNIIKEDYVYFKL